MVFLKEFSYNVNFEKKLADDKKNAKLPCMQCNNDVIFYFSYEFLLKFLFLLKAETW